jgi:uncharacterized protein YbjQ (UPF0145 family)
VDLIGMELLLILLIPLAFTIGCGATGAVNEQRHLRDLTAREAALAHILVTDLRSVPEPAVATGAVMVGGNVVIATDYLKQARASFRNLVGGEIRGYETLMDRGRREARLRMLDEATRAGAIMVINVRFTAAEVGQGMELICYGTAIRSR